MGAEDYRVVHDLIETTLLVGNLRVVLLTTWSARIHQDGFMTLLEELPGVL